MTAYDSFSYFRLLIKTLDELYYKRLKNIIHKEKTSQSLKNVSKTIQLA